MNTLPLPTVKEISFEELTTLLPTDCRIYLRVDRPFESIPDNRVPRVEHPREDDERYTLTA